MLRGCVHKHPLLALVKPIGGKSHLYLPVDVNMAAASATMRPQSASSSGSSTPWLSPEAPSTAWRSSQSTSVDLSRRTSSASNSSGNNFSGSEPSSSHDPHSAEWWEHVLPPGQLAERLRKAQRSGTSHRRNNSALANATPSERSAWKRLSGLPSEKSQPGRSESSTAASSRRSSFQGHSSTLPRSALKSDYRSHGGSSLDSGNVSQSGSSHEVSSDEFGGTSTGQHSPQSQSSARFAFPTGLPHAAEYGSSTQPGVRTTGNSPELASATWSTAAATMPAPLLNVFDSGRNGFRSTGSRRMRVMSEDGISSSLFAASQSTSSCRLPSSQSAHHLNHLTATHDASNRASTAADRNRSKFARKSLPDTPELSSDEATEITSVNTTTQRIRKTSTTRTTVRTFSQATSPPAILRSHFDQPEQPPCPLGSKDGDGHIGVDRGDRHVSFEQATQASKRASVHDYTEPMTSSQSAFSFGSLPGREYTSPFDTLPPRSNSTRRPRQGVRVSGRRTTSFSLPGSRRGSIRGESPFQFEAVGAQASNPGHRRTSSIPDVALLESLNVAHKQLASAGSLAITLTRQLSAPLRPVFHMTLFLSISSITVLSLACFLCASYMLTAWDDVSKRTHKVGEVASRTRVRFERTLEWGIHMLGSGDATSTAAAGQAASDAQSASRAARGATSSAGKASKDGAEAKSRGPVLTAGHAFLWPARMAWSGASNVAHRITPPTISKIFEQNREQGKGKARANTRPTLPPRPPLSTLLPSILFTLLLAFGAGLTSFLASRRAAAAEASSGDEQDTSSAQPQPHPYTVPMSSSSSAPGTEYVFLGSSRSKDRTSHTWEREAKRRSTGNLPSSSNSTIFVR